ncbi:MAG: anion permease [Candidatus Nanohalobium sp.]
MIEGVTIIALAASVFMGISIGSSTIASAYGPVNSAGAINVLRSAMLAGIMAFFGAITQGHHVTKTVGKGILQNPTTNMQASIILLTASILVIISVLTDYPMPTAFTVIGAVIGIGLTYQSGLKTATVAKIIGFWLAVPFLSLGISYQIAKILRKNLEKEGNKKKINALLLVSGSYVAYTAGASAVGLAIGPLTTLKISTNYLLILGATSILLGAWFYSPRIIRAISLDYSNIGPRRSIAALITAGALAQIGVLLGIPISFNEAIIASIIGSGLVEGKSSVDKEKILFTGFAWISAFIIAIITTFLLGKLII